MKATQQQNNQPLTKANQGTVKHLLELIKQAKEHNQPCNDQPCQEMQGPDANSKVCVTSDIYINSQPKQASNPLFIKVHTFFPCYTTSGDVGPGTKIHQSTGTKLILK